MKVFRDLYVFATVEQSKCLAERMTNSIRSPWHRDEAAEERERVRTQGDGEVYYFTRNADAQYPAAILLLMRRDGSTLCVPNIVPAGAGRLSIDQYNDILLDFVNGVFKPAKPNDMEFNLTSDEKSIDDWLSPETVKHLRSFSGLANKSTGSSHFLDQKRWFTFLAAANGEDKRLPADMLRRWLMEQEDWGEASASRLAGEYQFAMDLLDHVRGAQG